MVMLLSLCRFCSAQVFEPGPSSGYSVYHGEAGSWGGIYCKTVARDERIFVQVYDLSRCSMDMLLFGVSNMGKWDGRYNPDKVNPYFRKTEHDSAFELYKGVYGDNVLGLTNAVFFEAPSESLTTQLAYPVQYGGVLLSSGGSPNGPDLGKYPLQTLLLGDSSAAIHEYDPAQGFSARDGQYPTQIVTINYQDHPAVREFPRLPGGYRSRFHLITAIRNGDSHADNILVLITSNYVTSIVDLANEVKKLCPSATDDRILTLDGGSSISFLDRDGAEVIPSGKGVRVPMYLGIRLKGSIQSTVIRIMNPREHDFVHHSDRYFIFYYSASSDDFGLYRDQEFVEKLNDPGARSHRGLFVWDPAGVASGGRYQVRMRSPAGEESATGYFTLSK
jgi:hypothetical protein